MDDAHVFGIGLHQEEFDDAAHLRGLRGELVRIVAGLSPQLRKYDEVNTDRTIGELARPLKQGREYLGILHVGSRHSHHSQPTGFGNRRRKLWSRNLSQAGLLNWYGAAYQFGEARRQHRVLRSVDTGPQGDGLGQRMRLSERKKILPGLCSQRCQARPVTTRCERCWHLCKHCCAIPHARDQRLAIALGSARRQENPVAPEVERSTWADAGAKTASRRRSGACPTSPRSSEMTRSAPRTSARSSPCASASPRPASTCRSPDGATMPASACSISPHGRRREPCSTGSTAAALLTGQCPS